MIRASHKQKPSIWYPGLRSGHPLSRGLVGLWPFWEGTGGKLMDVSGHGNYGTLTNMDPATDWSSGSRGMELAFDGSDDYETTPKVFDVHTAPGITCAALIIRHRVAAGEWLISEQGTANNNNEVELYLDDTPAGGENYVTWRVWEGTTDNYANSDNTVLDEPIFIVGTCDWDRIKLYINGALEDDNACSGAPSATASTWYYNSRAGLSHHAQFTWIFRAIYDRALSASDVFELYEDWVSLITPRRRTYFWAAASGGAPPVGNRRRRLLLAG